MKHILIADDEESIRLTFAEFLRDEDYTVFTLESLPECLHLLQDIAIDVLFLDVNLGHENSLETIQEIRQIQGHCKINMITGGEQFQLYCQGQAIRSNRLYH